MEASADTDVGGGREEGTQGNLLSDAPLLRGGDECVAGGSRRRLFLLHAALQSLPILPEEARTSSSIYQNRSRSVLTRQHSAASHVDKRSAARLTRPAEAELSLFFDPAAPVALLLLTSFILLLAVFV